LDVTTNAGRPWTLTTFDLSDNFFKPEHLAAFANLIARQHSRAKAEAVAEHVTESDQDQTEEPSDQFEEPLPHVEIVAEPEDEEEEDNKWPPPRLSAVVEPDVSEEDQPSSQRSVSSCDLE
jgi:hypothetical protein